MIKRIFSVILIITLSLTSFIPISAKTSISSENEFKEIEKNQIIEETTTEMTVEVANPSTTAQEDMKNVADSKKKTKGGRKTSKYAKNKVKEVVEKETAEKELATEVVPQDAEISPVIEKDADVTPKKEE